MKTMTATIKASTAAGNSYRGIWGCFGTARRTLVNMLPVVGSRPSRCTVQTIESRIIMLWTIAVIVLLLWALGMITSYTLGGLIHILLVVALVFVLVRLIQGRRLT